MTAVHFRNDRIEEETRYFLYIGELKNYGLNLFLQEALERLENHRYRFIAIVPDIFEQYNYPNIIVINPARECLAARYGEKVNCRVAATEFMEAVSTSESVRNLIHELLRHQSRLYIYMYESLPQMTLDEIEGVSILGPDKAAAHLLNNKPYQFEHLADRLPLVEFRICKGRHELRKTTDKLWERWNEGIFVSRAYSAAGINSAVVHSAGELAPLFGDRKEDTFLATRYLPHRYDPTVLAVVAGKDQVYVAGIADQRIEGGNRFTGSTFPSVLGGETVTRLRDYTVTVGRWMAGQGYRGIFGCDYLVTDTGEIRFLEINARKQGTTLEFCCTLEQALPAGAPMLPELEYWAVRHGFFPDTAQEMEPPYAGIHWGTYNYKLTSTVHTDGFIPQRVREREAFASIAAGRLDKDFLILEHTGSDFVVAQGSFIGRIVALGKNHDSVDEGIRIGKKTIDLTIERQLT